MSQERVTSARRQLNTDGCAVDSLADGPRLAVTVGQGREHALGTRLARSVSASIPNLVHSVGSRRAVAEPVARLGILGVGKFAPDGAGRTGAITGRRRQSSHLWQGGVHHRVTGVRGRRAGLSSGKNDGDLIDGAELGSYHFAPRAIRPRGTERLARPRPRGGWACFRRHGAARAKLACRARHQGSAVIGGKPGPDGRVGLATRGLVAHFAVCRPRLILVFAFPALRRGGVRATRALEAGGAFDALGRGGGRADTTEVLSGVARVLARLADAAVRQYSVRARGASRAFGTGLAIGPRGANVIATGVRSLCQAGEGGRDQRENKNEENWRGTAIVTVCPWEGEPRTRGQTASPLHTLSDPPWAASRPRGTESKWPGLSAAGSGLRGKEAGL